MHYFVSFFSAFCALAEPWESFLIGVVGGTVALAGIEIIDKLKIDDPVGEYIVGLQLYTFNSFTHCSAILFLMIYYKD